MVRVSVFAYLKDAENDAGRIESCSVQDRCKFSLEGKCDYLNGKRKDGLTIPACRASHRRPFFFMPKYLSYRSEIDKNALI